MNILNEIIAHKKTEVADRKALFPTKLLERSLYFSAPSVSLKKYVTRPDKTGIIAEIKRKSPSKGWINQHISVEQVSIGYMQSGASAMSVLTDEKYFGGSNKDLSIARQFNFSPILRKDFIVDEYQIVEAKSIGADAILLIAAALEVSELNKLADFAHSLGLEVLLETHSQEEIQAYVSDKMDLVGINSRDLKTFEVDLERTKELAQLLPKEMVKVAESGIHSPEDVLDLKAAGFQGFLIGEQFMKDSRPELTCQLFSKKLKAQYQVSGS